MNILQKLARNIIKKSFNFSVWTIEQFNDIQLVSEKLNELKELPAGTLGNDIAKCLDDHQLRLVPNMKVMI